MCLGVSSRSSTNSISRFESYRVSNTGARWIFDCDSLLWLLLLHLCDSLWHDEPDGADQTDVGGLRAELQDLRSTAARLMEQASRLTERCAELEDLISRGTPKPSKS